MSSKAVCSTVRWCGRRNTHPPFFIQMSPLLTPGLNCSFQVSHRSEKSRRQPTQKTPKCQSPWAGGLCHHGRAAGTPALAMEGSEPQGCSQEQSSPQAWLVLTTSVRCWLLLEMGCWLGEPPPGAAQSCLGLYGWRSKIRYSVAHQFTELSESNDDLSPNEMVLLLQNRTSQNYYFW